MTSTHKLDFCKQMRKATREIHDISDAFVNAKLGIALTDDKVWAEGLLCFYEIFKFLEEALDRLNHTLLSELDIEGMRRTQQFKEDLNFWYGEEWMENVYKPKPVVTSYIDYLKTLEMENPIMLSAYIYHLYVGLFSGGQILRKKRELEASFKFGSATDSLKGQTVTVFSDILISKLRREMVNAIEHIAEQLGEEDRALLIQESINVFKMNNKMIRSINTNKVVIKSVIKFSLIAIPTVLLVVYVGKMLFSSNSENA